MSIGVSVFPRKELTKLNLETLISMFTGVLQIIGFVVYNKGINDGNSRPNIATWFLCVFLTVINCTSYLVMSADIVKSILPIVSSALCIWTFFFTLSKGKFSRLGKYEIATLVIGFISVLVWWYYKSATYANMIMQVSIVITFIPTFIGVNNGSGKEQPAPWFIWTSAYMVMMVVIFLRWSGNYTDLVYPINCMILHFLVGFLSIKRQQKIVALSKAS